MKIRNKKKDKKKNTFNKYGKNTKRGLRIKLKEYKNKIRNNIIYYVKGKDTRSKKIKNER